MKKFLMGSATGFVLVLLISFILTRVTSKEITSSDFAIVTIKNRSGHYAKSVTIKHEKGTLEAFGLQDSADLRFIFENRAENAYQMIVVLDNGRTLTSQEVYFERGYRATETIKESEIITENNW